MEFKGTKGIWTKNGINGVHSENLRCVAITYQNDDINDVRPYDALLISKAPELLAILKDVKDLLDSYPSESEMHLKASEIRTLIKEATEL